MQSYTLLPIQSKAFTELQLDPWKMNTLIMDLKRQLLVVGCKSYLQFFTIGGFEIIMKDKISIDQGDIINQIKQYDNLLFATTMNSWIYIYDLDNILVKPIKLQGLYEGISDCSIWSIDICDKYLAVGSNSHIISLWSRVKLTFDAPDHQSWDDREIRVKFCEAELNSEDVQFPKRYSIQNHKHNIPCVQFSPCNNYLASGSIDSVMRIYLVENGTQIYQISFTEWVWGIQWILIDKDSSDSEEELTIESYQICVALQDKIELCSIKKGQLKHDGLLYKHTSPNIQRFQQLYYLQDLSILFAGILQLLLVPQHDKQLCYLEIFNKGEIQKTKNLQIDLGDQFLLSSNVKQIENSTSILIGTLSWQKQISLYLLEVL